MRRLVFTATAVVTVVLASSAVAAAGGWTVQQTPNPAGGSDGQLWGVSCQSKSACTAVGDYTKGGTDLTLAERWNGRKWSIEHTPNPIGGSDSELYGVSCESKSACTAVGQYYYGTTDLTLAERWNGAKWSIERTPNPTGGLNNGLTGVSCTSTSACTAVGYYYNGTTRDLALAEHWNGAKWSMEQTPKPAGGLNDYLSGVSCTSVSACSATGYTSNGTNTTEVPLAERWHGRKWTIEQTPKPAGGSESELNGVSCASASFCTAVGYSGANRVTLAERWNGAKWSIQHTPNPTGGSTSGLSGVSCTSASGCTAVGYYHHGMLAERWNGAKWSIQHTPNPTGGSGTELFGVSCESASACTAVGDYEKGTNGLTLAEHWIG